MSNRCHTNFVLVTDIDIGFPGPRLRPPYVSRSRFPSISRIFDRGNEAAIALSPMRTLTCTIKFDDGMIVRVGASAESLTQTVRFEFAGDTSRLSPFAEKGTLGFLQHYMKQNCAAHSDAMLDISSEGEFSVTKR